MQVKISFFFFSFFCFFSDQCYRDPLYPTCWVLNPISPPHNPPPCASPLKPCKSPLLPLLHYMQAHGHFYLCHMQVCHHRYPITGCKIHPRRRLITCKPHCDAIPTRHARPAMTLTRHAQALPW